MDPCTELVSRVWLSTVDKVAPRRAARIAAEESLLLARQQTETDMQNMQRRRTTLEAQIESLTKEARSSLTNKDQRAARAIIARRRRLLTQLSQVYDMIASLETTLDNYECSETNAALLTAFKNSTNAISVWQKKATSYTAEDADAIRQEFDDQMLAANEIAQIAAQPLVTQGIDSSIADMTVDDMMEELDDDTLPIVQPTTQTVAPGMPGKMQLSPIPEHKRAEHEEHAQNDEGENAEQNAEASALLG